MPCPSVSKLRLTPPLARSVGLGPVFFPAERRLGHRPIHTHPVPVDPAQFVKPFDPGSPEGEKHPGFDPFLKSVVGRRFRTQVRLVQGGPLASRSQDKENGIGAASVGHAWSSTAKAMLICVPRQQRFNHCPEVVRYPKAAGRSIVGRPCPGSFWCRLFAHAFQYIRYSDRL